MPRSARILGEARHQERADAAALPFVGHLDGDLGGPTVPHEARDPDRLAVDQRDEDVMVLVHTRQVFQVVGGEDGLRSAES